MKKKVFLAGSLIWVLVALVALAVLVVSLSGGNLSKFLPGWLNVGTIGSSFTGAIDSNTPLIKEEKLSLDNISELSVGTQYQAIRLTLIDGGEIALRHYDQESAPTFTSDSSGGRLVVNIPQRNFVSINMMSPRLEIDLPRAYAGAVKLDSTSGGINLDEPAEWGDTALASTSGSIHFKGGISCGDLSIKTSSGSINLGDINAAAVITDSTSGSQRYEEVLAKGEVALKATSGSINSSKISATDVRIQSTSGSIRTDDITAAGNAKISTASASQNVGILKAAAYDINCTSGSLRYDGLSGAGNLNCMSGSITCGALEVKGDVSSTSTSGSQRLTLVPDQNFELKISVTSGAIRAPNVDLSYSDRQGKNAFGTVGDGGAGTLAIRSNSGSVTIN